jgi:TetR/AcrR family transcriptional regulator
MNDESSRKRILDCALTLFSSRGYDGVGIAEICAAAGITKPTLYYHFSSKEGLYEALWQEEFAPLRQALTDTANYIPHPENYHRDVLPVLPAIITAYTGFARAHPAFFRLLAALMFAPDGSPSTAIALQYRTFQHTLFRTLFADMAHAHGNLAGKEELLSASFTGMIFSYISMKDTAHFAADDIARQFMHGIFS